LVVTPIAHGSREWLDLLERVDRLSRELTALNGNLNSLETQQELNHTENSDKINAVKRSVEDLDLLINGNALNKGLKTQIEVMIAVAQTTELHAKSASSWLRWGIMAILTLMLSITGAGTLYLQSIETHYKETQQIVIQRLEREKNGLPSNSVPIPDRVERVH
jgi:hypothetical protein